MQRLMAHLVAGYKTDEEALAVAGSLVAGGAKIIEVQLPFSDPSADGVAIQGACCEVLKRDYSTKDGLALVKKITQKFNVAVYLMSYGSLVVTPGVDNFCAKASDAGVSGLIIPDLPFDCDEGLLAASKKHGLFDIPVAAPSMTHERLQKLLRWLSDNDYDTPNGKNGALYAALRVGITGGKTTIDSKVTDFLSAIKNENKSGAIKVLGGFGIQTGDQARAVAPYVDYIVAGSVFVNMIKNNDGLDAITKKAKELCE